MKVSLIIAITAMHVLAGCALAPGMHMQEQNGATTVPLPVIEAGEPAVETIPITQIDAAWVRDQTSSRTNEALALARPYEPYRVGPRDVLTITVWDHPELTIPAGEFRSADISGYRVGEDGKLFYPYVGVVTAAGKTVEELRRLLTEGLAPFIANPQLDVRVATFRSQRTYVVGELVKPGVQVITDVPLTVTEALDRAGGPNPAADMSRTTLARDGNIYRIDLNALYQEGDITQNVLLQDGDVLNIPDRAQNKILVMGEVLKPESQLMVKSRKTLAEAISDAGGVSVFSSDPRRIYVFRNRPDRPLVFRLDGKTPDAMLLAERFELEPRDVVYVDTAGVSRWNRVLSQLLPSFNVTTRLLPGTAQ